MATVISCRPVLSSSLYSQNATRGALPIGPRSSCVVQNSAPSGSKLKKTLHSSHVMFSCSSGYRINNDFSKFSTKTASFSREGKKIPSVITNALPKDGPSDPQDQDLTATIASVGIGCLWAALAAYAFLLAPNQTPYQDRYFVEKLLNIHADDGYILNPVLVSLWNLMGIWPLVYAMLLVPTARSSKGPPIWPFSALSVFVGAFALLPYFALWRPDSYPPLPSEEEKKAWIFRILDSKITAVFLGVGALALFGNAILAGDEAWKEFGQYFRGSRLVHITSIDFLILCGMAPFWLYNDMTVREWNGRDMWWGPMAAVPLIGPIIHLLTRPKLP